MKMVKFNKEKARNLVVNVAMPVALCACTLAILVVGNTALAADAKGLLTKVFQIIAKIITGLGAVYGVLGIVHYAAAQSEGDGPAKNKAMGQIAAGIMLVALSLLLNTEASALAGFIN